MLPMKQWGAQMVFEDVDLTADGSGRHTEFLRRRSDTGQAPYNFKNTQRIERRGRFHQFFS